MWRSTCVIQVGLPILLTCAFAGTTLAALLAEIGINVEPTFDVNPPSTDTVLYRFSVLSLLPTPVFGEWALQVTSGDVGSTFEANPLMVNAFAGAFTRSSADVTIRVNNISYSKPLDQLQSSGWGLGDRATFQKYVPDITKVPVNRVTMTISSFFFERFGGNMATIGGGHTVRIYGVPEPTVWASLLSICTLLCGFRRSRA